MTSDDLPPYKPPARRSLAASVAHGAVDAAITARHAARGTYRRLDRLAAATPVCDVLVVGPYKRRSRMPEVVTALRESRHRVTFVLGARDPEPDPALRDETRATGMRGLLMENRNRLLELSGGVEADWTIAVDDDVRFTHRWLDRFVALCHAFDLAIAGPALTRRSYRSWPVTARGIRSLVRLTRFVEIGPVVAFRADAARALLPFPADAGMGWGLDFQWPLVAGEHGWRMGIVDGAPIRHEDVTGSGYHAESAHRQLRVQLEQRPHVSTGEAERALTSFFDVP